MTTPIEKLDRTIAEIEAIYADKTLNAAQRAGALLPLFPRFFQETKDMMDFHRGYSLGHRRISSLGSKLLRTMLDASTGELKWAKELPEGTIPSEFRRALTDFIVHFKITPPEPAPKEPQK